MIKLAAAKVAEAVEKLEGFIVQVGTLTPEYIPEDVADELIERADDVIEEVT